MTMPHVQTSPSGVRSTPMGPWVPGGGAVDGAGRKRDVILVKLNLPELHRPGRIALIILVALRGIHEPERAIFFDQPVAPPSRRGANAPPIRICSHARWNDILRGVCRTGVMIRLPTPHPKRSIRFNREHGVHAEAHVHPIRVRADARGHDRRPMSWLKAGLRLSPQYQRLPSDCIATVSRVPAQTLTQLVAVPICIGTALPVFDGMPTDPAQLSPQPHNVPSSFKATE